MQTNGVIYVRRFLNCEVKSPSGEDLGKLEEVVADAERGQLAYGVISFHKGFMKGDKYFAVPWQTLELAKDDRTLLLDANKSMIENASAFDKNNWPNMADKRWGASVHAFFQCTPYWERSSAGSPGRSERDGMREPAFAGSSAQRERFGSETAGYSSRGEQDEGRYGSASQRGYEREGGRGESRFQTPPDSGYGNEGSREAMEERERTER